MALLLPDAAAAAGSPSSLLSRSVDALRGLEGVRRVLVAVPPGHHAPLRGRALPVDGDLRSLVDAAIEQAGPASAVVLHDPCCLPVDAAIVARGLAELREHACAAVVGAAPATDTLKLAGPTGTVVQTIHRSSMWDIRTPQVYRAESLKAALTRVAPDALEAAFRGGDHGFLPRFVDGPVRVMPLPREALRVQGAGHLRVVERLLSFSG